MKDLTYLNPMAAYLFAANWKWLFTGQLMVLFLLAAGPLPAQQEGPSRIYLEEGLRPRAFDKQDWQRATEGLDYSQDRKVEKKRKKAGKEEGGNGGDSPQERQQERRNITIGEGLSSGILKFLGFLALAIILALLLRALLGLESSPRDKKIRQQNEGEAIDLKRIEENIHESDLEAYLRQALEMKNYNLAIRLYYLAILKELSLKKAIQWKKNKTNRQYLAEMRQSPLSARFAEATRAFERAWYGGHPVDEHHFQKLEPQFRKLVKAVKA